MNATTTMQAAKAMKAMKASAAKGPMKATTTMKAAKAMKAMKASAKKGPMKVVESNPQKYMETYTRRCAANYPETLMECDHGFMKMREMAEEGECFQEHFEDQLVQECAHEVYQSFMYDAKAWATHLRAKKKKAAGLEG